METSDIITSLFFQLEVYDEYFRGIQYMKKKALLLKCSKNAISRYYNSPNDSIESIKKNLPILLFQK